MNPDYSLDLLRVRCYVKSIGDLARDKKTVEAIDAADCAVKILIDDVIPLLRAEAERREALEVGQA